MLSRDAMTTVKTRFGHRFGHIAMPTCPDQEFDAEALERSLSQITYRDAAPPCTARTDGDAGTVSPSAHALRLSPNYPAKLPQ